MSLMFEKLQGERPTDGKGPARRKRGFDKVGWLTLVVLVPVVAAVGVLALAGAGVH